MKDWLRAMALGVAALCCVRTAAGAPGATDYTETTTVEGKIPFDLRGAWLLVAHPETAEGKFRTFPQLLKVSANKDGGLTMHLLDVRLPKQIDEAAKKADLSLKAWTPSEKDLAALRKQWATLPRPAKKDVAAGDLVYDEVRFMLATPEHYGEVFPKQDDKIQGVLAESAFSFQVEERYRPQPLPPGSNIAQLALRRTIYGVRTASDKLIEGQQVIGWVAAGGGVPIPLGFGGPFKMYRLTAPDGKREG